MVSPTSIFLDFNLPNPTTWFYFSLLLAISLFFKFNRPFSVRNWDVITIFLLVPGLLLLQQARAQSGLAAVSLLAQLALLPTAGIGGIGGLASASEGGPNYFLWMGYLWLLVGSGYFLFRCFLDLTLVRRPALSPNLNKGGLVWLASALFICLIAVAYRQHERQDGPLSAPEHEGAKVGKESAAIGLAQTNLERWSPAWGGARWGLRALALLGHLVVVTGLVIFAWRHFQDLHAGMAAATFYLMLPYTGASVSQLHHVWPMALIVWALVCHRMPLLAGSLLGLAAGTIYFPALLIPLWWSFYRGRGSGRFLFAVILSAGAALGFTALALWWSDELARSVSEAIALSDWQPWKVPNAEGFWTGVHWAYRIPVFIAYLVLVLATAIWPMPKNLGHVIALSAALFIGLQFWYADQGGVYILWYLPLMLLLVFRPNLSDRFAPPIVSETDWLARTGRTLHRWMRWWVRTPQPVEK